MKTNNSSINHLNNKYDFKSIKIETSYNKAFEYIANPSNLPLWTTAFLQANEEEAILSMPDGQLKIGLDTISSKEYGIIDWKGIMPDGSLSITYSRIFEIDGSIVYSIFTQAPKVPEEILEEVFSNQKETLQKELKVLKELLEKG